MRGRASLCFVAIALRGLASDVHFLAFFGVKMVARRIWRKFFLEHIMAMHYELHEDTSKKSVSKVQLSVLPSYPIPYVSPPTIPTSSSPD